MRCPLLNVIQRALFQSGVFCIILEYLVSPSRHRSKRLPALHTATPAKVDLNVTPELKACRHCMKEHGNSFFVIIIAGVLKSSVAGVD